MNLPVRAPQMVPAKRIHIEQKITEGSQVVVGKDFLVRDWDANPASPK